MCGIGGILYKESGSTNLAPIGEELIRMLEAMKHRGLDSSGVTIAGEPLEEDLLLRIWADPDGDYRDCFHRVEEVVAEKGVVVRTRGAVGEYLRLGVNYEGEMRELAEALIDIDGVEIHSMGESSEVIKDVGSGVEMDRKHDISSLSGTHGIGHVRMATESRVDISHAHPFWAYPFPDVTVVHNGQLTNYHKLKRAYEDKEHRFQTENDSELIAVYLADRLSKGASLQSALEDSLEDLDGTFTYLVSTKDGIGVAKDQWAAKPLVLMEGDNVVALASEEVALRKVFPDEIERVEPQEKEVMTWLI
ncbi:MAG: class II glutamine amidotransferase [Dehalococcoidia bacterium]